MLKHILIISNPGEQGSDNYCNGVNVDVRNYLNFFKSPLGGAWYSSEIIHLERPTVIMLRNTLETLKNNDYLKIIFCGHGYYSDSKNTTVLELKKNEEFDCNELRGISSKQTIILDCCRKIHHDLLLEERAIAKFAKGPIELNSNDCRRYYELKIKECSPGIIITYGCDINELAGDSSSQGGYFSSSLLRVCRNIHENSSLDVTTKYEIHSIVNVFNKAIPIVQKLSGNTQNPQIEKPRTENYFPFAVLA